MTKTTPKEIASKIHQIGARGREAWNKGEFGKAEEEFLAAWKEVPDPKEEFDYGQILSRGLVVFFRDTKQFEKAYQWLDVVRRAYQTDGISDPGTAFLVGTVHFESGRLDEAFLLFDKLYKEFKGRPFQGEDKKYLDFYKKRR